MSPAETFGDLRCPAGDCGGRASRVLDTRGVRDGSRIRRRRRCDVCGALFTTYERIDTGKVSSQDARAVLEAAQDALGRA